MSTMNRRIDTLAALTIEPLFGDELPGRPCDLHRLELEGLVVGYAAVNGTLYKLTSLGRQALAEERARRLRRALWWDWLTRQHTLTVLGSYLVTLTALSWLVGAQWSLRIYGAALVLGSGAIVVVGWRMHRYEGRGRK